MKKIYSFIVAAVAMIAASSCNKVVLPENVFGDNVIAFTASFDGIGTKVKLEGGKSKWETTDKITIHNGTEGFVFNTEQSGESVSFLYDNTNEDFSGNKFIAVYPADNHTVDIEKKTIIANIPTFQEAVKGSFNKSAALAIAHTEDEHLEFKNATALLKFTVNSSNIKAVEFYGNNSEPISGDMLIPLNEDNSIGTMTGQKTMIDGKSQFGTWVKIYGTAAKNFYLENGATYYLPIAPATFTKGVSMNVLVDEGEVKVEKFKTITTEQIFKPNDVIDLGIIEEKKIYLAQGMWADANAWVFAHFIGDDDWTEDRRMTDSDGDGILEVSVPYRAKEVIFVRKNPSDKNVNWNNVWDQSSQLILPTNSNNCYVINDWSNMAWTALSTARGRMLYLTPSTNWKSSNARFAAYFFIQNSSSTWRSMTDYNSDGIYEVYIPNNVSYKMVIFCRMNPNFTNNSWDADGNDYMWNQTGDLTIPTNGNNLFTVPSNKWDGATTTWSKKTF